jgi:hypothetical protein
MRIRDPGWKQFGYGMEKSRIRDPDPESGSGIRIRDKHPGSATLPTNLECKVKKPKIPTKYPHVSPFSANFNVNLFCIHHF